MNKVKVKLSKGINQRGVFALKNIAKSELIEKCPLILLPMAEMKIIDKTTLKYYYFELTDKNFAIVLGYGSLYNHSYDANAIYHLSAREKIMKISAVKDIGKGEEIFINYNWRPDNKTPLTKWFDPNFKDLSK